MIYDVFITIGLNLKEVFMFTKKVWKIAIAISVIAIVSVVMLGYFMQDLVIEVAEKNSKFLGSIGVK